MRLKLLFLCIAIGYCLSTVAQVANQPSVFLLCDNDFPYGDGIAEFDLLTKDAEVLLGQNPNDYQVTYHFSSEQANNGTNAISSPFTNLFNPQTLWVRVEELSSGNFDTTILDLVVLETPIIPDTDLYVCDDDNDGEVELNFSDTESGFSISYYLTANDAELGVNQLAFPVTYQEADIPSQLYARSDSPDGCFYVVPRALYYGSYVEANPLTPYEICGANEEGSFFLPIKNGEVTGGESWFVSYHLNQNDAENDINALPDNYTNITNPQTIYVRVENSACYDVTSLDLIVNEGSAPVINSLPTESLCPLEPGFVDLTSFESQLIDNPNNYQFSYYVSQGDMTQGVNEISDPLLFEFNTSIDEIFVRVTDNISGCYSFAGINFDFNAACTVSCDTGLNLEYCYTTEDDSFTFTSEDGSPLFLEFNSGTFYVQGLVPRIRVLDTDGTTLYIGTGEFVGNQIWDLSGLIFQSSGDTITLEIDVASNSQGCEFDVPGLVVWDIDVFCSTSEGVINAQAFLDDNMNLVYDTYEVDFTQGYFTYEKNNDGEINTVFSSNGSFFIIPESQTDSYDINFYLNEEYLACYDITAPSFNDISVSVGQNIQLNVPVIEDQLCEDLSVNLISTNVPPRPGFNYEMELVYKNEGFVDISSGTIIFTADLLVDYISVESNPNYSILDTGQGFVLEFTDLAPGEDVSATITLYCPPSVELGTMITSYAFYATIDNDVYDENNYSDLSLEVVGSWDPNDKIESHGPRIVFDDFMNSDEWLYYTIRFQNLGTAEAIFVRIEDELDAQLDEDTFQMIRSSHDYTVTRNGTSLEWFFDNINLPAEQDDPEGSNGYVYFRIKPKAGYALNDIIPNTASIFFDFNEAVVTNTFQSQFVEDELSVTEFSVLDFELFPNPAKDYVNVIFNSSDSKNLALYNILGKKVVSVTVESETYQLNMRNLNNGIYFLTVLDNGKSQTKKLIVNKSN